MQAAHGLEDGGAEPGAPGSLAHALARLWWRGLRAGGRVLTGSDPGIRELLEDPLDLRGDYLALSARLAADPVGLAHRTAALWLDLGSVAQRAFLSGFGLETGGPDPQTHRDRRFADPAWDALPAWQLLRDFYLVSARWMVDTVDGVRGLDPERARKVGFFTRQVADALSPSNYPLTNPAVVGRTVETGGRNLVNGLARLLDDIERHHGRISPDMVDESAFEVGVNIATTPGKVVFQNDLMQLIQYAPATAEVARRPLLIVPPWLNKYYVMDLSPRNSMIRWLVEQGQTVFVISWVNPDDSLAGKRFDDYMLEGPLAALDAIEAVTGEASANVAGYCLGGILLAATAGYLAARGEARRIASATYFTTMVDFSDVGEIRVFMDPARLERLERRIEAQGYLDGNSIAATFRMLRANDLVWSFYINNYLLDREPMPFDLLYWNSDATRLPACMHLFFMRRMYLENRLREPGGIELDGTPIDVTKVRTPAYVVSTAEDHIAPWKTGYQTTQLFAGPVRFVLGESGHIAGVVNPPSRVKYGYWTRDDNPPDAEQWLAGAQHREGSWWPHWHRWVEEHADGRVPARVPGDGELAPIEDAPGSYVKVRRD